ncbi:DUF5376 family protein [Fusobacterium animalis]|uniref:Uncharacterized protein n=1 Tax=Fusobacterium nucleatum TaxID=851 RepID=A0A133NJ51_FUSNU|nr:DUF5376 family protein [Fusobacterium nucleatum]KXA16291.1 hypothetical protein HMPREF3221_02054 [Fusobacterium nucleatum]MCL4583887.1 hypothetical protein [Fusobacterium nucleatum YWH7054]MCL4592752.1 hypothetical protein [Fusobacterium nucleatum YWH7053]
MLLKFYYAENRKIKKLSHVVTTENKYKYIHFYLYNPFGVDFFKFSKKVLEENLPRDPSGEDTAVDIEGDKVIMYDIYFDGDEPDELLEMKKEDLIYIIDRWIKFLEKPITDENYEEIFEIEDPVVKVLKDGKYIII